VALEGKRFGEGWLGVGEVGGSLGALMAVEAARPR